MIVLKEETGVKKNGEKTYDYKLNIDFWKKQSKKQPISVVLDEAHAIIDARRSMSRTNRLFNQWLSLIRRVLGQSESGYGELVFITQLHNRIDCVAREMATQVRYHICHYSKKCKKCCSSWSESSESPEPLHVCPACGSSKVIKCNHRIESYHFKNMQAYTTWKDFGINTFYRHYLTDDIERYFPLYDTLQWENLLTNY